MPRGSFKGGFSFWQHDYSRYCPALCVSPAQPVSNISAGRSSMLNQRASSDALIGEDERCVNRSMSTAVANVLNPQNAVASCIRGMGVISGCILTVASTEDVLI